MVDHGARILIAAHKPYWIPPDGMYLPVQVGSSGKPSIEGFQRDDEGDSISHLNPRYSELTALWWGWKNLDAPYMGLAHYRRHFKGTGEKNVLTAAELDALLSRAAVVLPKKRRYYIETVGAHYGHTFDAAQLDLVRDVLVEREPGYVEAFDRHLRRRSAHIYNMFVMRADLLDAYCSWMFPLLACIDERLDYTGMSAFEARAPGRLSERLLDPWLDVNAIDYVECPVVSTEPVNWVKKGGAFLLAKFGGRKYTESF